MQWHVGVTTAPRRANYLDNTLEQISQAGWNGVRLVNDDPDLQGPWRNFKDLLGLITQYHAQADSDCVLIFQDDVLVTSGARSYLETCGQTPTDSRPGFIKEVLDDGDIVSLYTASPHDQPSFGWRQIDHTDLPRKCYGALGVCMSAKTASELLSMRDLGKHVKNKTDQWIGKFCQLTNRDYWQHTPSLIYHLGIVSSLERPEGDHASLSEFRQCRRFAVNADSKSWGKQ